MRSLPPKWFCSCSLIFLGSAGFSAVTAAFHIYLDTTPCSFLGTLFVPALFVYTRNPGVHVPRGTLSASRLPWHRPRLSVRGGSRVQALTSVLNPLAPRPALLILVIFSLSTGLKKPLALPPSPWKPSSSHQGRVGGRKRGPWRDVPPSPLLLHCISSLPLCFLCSHFQSGLPPLQSHSMFEQVL